MAKSKRLVVEHLEDVSRNVLESYSDTIAKRIRGRPGVYALYKRNKLYYVGLASNLMRRLKQHLKDNHGSSWDRFSVYLTVHDEHTKELESLLLRIVKPRGNKQSGRFMDSTNLKAPLNRSIKSADDDRRAALLGGKVARRRRRTKARQGRGSLVLAGVVERRMKLRAHYKGYEYTAFLRRDGKINYGGTLYSSPTAAATAIVNRAVSGWVFWKYRNPKGEWVRLRTLRK